MKKFTIALILIALCLTAVLFTACDVGGQDLSENCIRIHIRANSNSDTDQSVKLLVRDEVIAFLETKLAVASSKSEAYSIIGENLAAVQQIANTVLNANGFYYGSKSSLRNETFPEKTYGENTFPAGNYDALILELGSGTGDNWWCVAFPPLCFVGSENGEKVVYKSLFKELWDKLF